METTLLLIGLIIFFASFTQGFSGFGFALVTIPLLSLLIDIKQAIPLGALCGLAVNIYLFIQLKAQIDFKELRQLIVGSAIGIPLGVFFLSETEPDILKMILGIIILIFVILLSIRNIKVEITKPGLGYIIGLISGLLGGAFNTNGPPVLIYFMIKKYDKDKFKASVTGFFLFTSVVIVSMHMIMGITTNEVLTDFVIFVPFVIAGILLGSYFFKYASTTFYRKLILVFLSIASVILIFGQ